MDGAEGLVDDAGTLIAIGGLDGTHEHPRLSCSPGSGRRSVHDYEAWLTDQLNAALLPA
ncbi:MAG: hypothetical protein M3198_01885 [Actinomycetota bacterium]|nr:hypothetical protein [Actinomycetota bacterium]